MKKIYVGIGHGEIMKPSEQAISKVFGEENVFTLTHNTKNEFGNNFTNQELLIEAVKQRLEGLAKDEKITIHIALNFPESVYETESFNEIRWFISELKKLPNCEFEFSTPQTNNPPGVIAEKFNTEEDLIDPNKIFITCPSRVGAYCSYFGKGNLMLEVLKNTHDVVDQKDDFKEFQKSGWNLCCMPALIWDVLSKKSGSREPEKILKWLKDNPFYKETLIKNFKNIVANDREYGVYVESVIEKSIKFLEENQEKSLGDIIKTVATTGGATEKMLKSFDGEWQKNKDSQASLEKIAAEHIADWSKFKVKKPRGTLSPEQLKKFQTKERTK